MTILRTLLLIVEALCAILLIGVILLQKSKNEGLGLAFGSGMGETLFGSRAGNVLTKITITLGITFLVTTTLLAVLTTSSHERSLIDERVADTPLSPTGPAAPAAPQQMAPAAVSAPAAAPAAEPTPQAIAAPMPPALAPPAQSAPPQEMPETAPRSL